MPNRKPEPTQRRNPHKLTVNQHIHSAAAIARFANADGLVTVLRKAGGPCFRTKAENAVFCVPRVWSEHAERGFFAKVEQKYQEEVDRILKTNVIDEHQAITSYLIIWQLRSDLAGRSSADVQLHGITGVTLTKDQEETIESKWAGFNRSGTLPARFADYPRLVRDYDAEMVKLRGATWGVLRTSGTAQFICPDRPASQLFMPITPSIALYVSPQNGTINDAGVERTNSESWNQSTAFVVGNPKASWFLDGQE